jgi:glycosyltransferase involved in cell wall biosynthesis
MTLSTNGVGPDERRLRVAICDYMVTARVPIGSCHLALLEELCEEIDFTVFAAEFENPRPDRIRFVRVPVFRRPLAAIFIAYHIAVLPIFYWMTWVKGLRFDLVQSTETYSFLGDICYAHFCHRRYLREHWPRSPGKGINRLARWLDHFLRASIEGLLYRRVRAVIVPSLGLERELRDEYSLPESKVTVLSNPIDLERFARPTDFDAGAVRRQLNVSDEDVLAIFIALGHFERKGLPYILTAMQSMSLPNFKLLIVGGQESLIGQYKAQAQEIGLRDKVIFIGLQNDVRPFLWASDMFLFPSHYEVFSLVTLQAAASGLPIVTTRINGTEEFLEDEGNGFYIDCSASGVQDGVQKFFNLTAIARARMGSSAQQSVARFGRKNFGRKWHEFYANFRATN